MYLTQAQVEKMLRSLADLGGPGSRLAVNFGVGFEQQGSQRGRLARKVMAAGGEELRFRLAPGDVSEFLAKFGWTFGQMLLGPQLRDQYLSDTKLAAVNVSTTGFVVSATL